MNESMKRFSGRTAVVTGAASGIGRSIACRLAREGADVALGDINEAGLQETAAAVEGFGVKAFCHICDMSSLDDIAQYADAVLQRCERVDILVNNAGTGDSNTALEDIDPALWDHIYTINVKGPFFLTQRLVREMIARKNGGRIINIASTEGKTNRAGTIVYSSSKHALIGLTQGLAFQLAPYDITVNAVCPGLIDTPIWHKGDRAMDMPQGSTINMVVESSIQSMQLKIARAGTPEDIAGAVAFLCSDDASYMTGQAINVCGGLEYH